MAERKPTPLEKAIAAPRYDREVVHCTEDEMDLVFAYIELKITHAQVQAAIGKKRNVSSWMGRVLIAGARAGKIRRVKPEEQADGANG